MKTRIILATIGATALTAFAASAVSGNTLLSPRAAANQIKTNPGITETHAMNGMQTASPRCLANQTRMMMGMASDRNPYLECRNTMTGSPKAVQACSENWPYMHCGHSVNVATVK